MVTKTKVRPSHAAEYAPLIQREMYGTAVALCADVRRGPPDRCLSRNARFARKIMGLLRTRLAIAMAMSRVGASAPRGTGVCDAVDGNAPAWIGFASVYPVASRALAGTSAMVI